MMNKWGMRQISLAGRIPKNLCRYSALQEMEHNPYFLSVDCISVYNDFLSIWRRGWGKRVILQRRKLDKYYLGDQGQQQVISHVHNIYC